MAKIRYKSIRIEPKKLAVIEQANVILMEYEAQGFDLTLRQLYYQFVARGLIPNTHREYKNLGDAISDGRLAGHIDWNHIVDRTRNVRGNQHWENPSEIVQACARSFQIDKWTNQEYRYEVWIEKDALVGVVEGICRKLDVSFFSCRGYVSMSEMHEAAIDRLIPFEEAGQTTEILHLGDHDPSGVDMSRDIQDRLQMFGSSVTVTRLALNMDQVRQYNPPPNPAKITDSRAKAYIEKYGDESWELDALEPRVLSDLISEYVDQNRSGSQWKKKVGEETKMKRQLQTISDTLDKS